VYDEIYKDVDEIAKIFVFYIENHENKMIALKILFTVNC